MCKILVCGGRDFTDYLTVKEVLDSFYNEDTGVTCIIQGGAKGADFLAKVWANEREIDCKEYKADWDKHKKAAGPIRNMEMLLDSKPDIVVAFRGGKGTAHMVSIARKAGVVVHET